MKWSLSPRAHIWTEQVRCLPNASGSKSILIIFINLQSALQIEAEGFQPHKVFLINTERSPCEVKSQISHTSELNTDISCLNNPSHVQVLPPAPARLLPVLPAQNTLVIAGSSGYSQRQKLSLLNLQSFPNMNVSYSLKARNRETSGKQCRVKAVTQHSTVMG